MTDAELQYYHFGFYRALKRYRSTSMLGWTIVLLGCLSVPVGWEIGRTTGIVEIGLTVMTTLAGLALVWQNISALEEYLRVPFPFSTDEKTATIVADIRDIMQEVDNGGWQEAFEAIGKLRILQHKHQLPPLEAG